MRKVIQAAGFVGLLSAAFVMRAQEPTKPVKVGADQAAGAIFSAPGVKHDSRFGPTDNLELLVSKDKRYTSGVYRAGASDFAIDAYPEDEFCYFLSGSVRLTSADGSIVELKAGDAVVIPKGWKGRWTTTGYSKYYTVYDPTK